MNRLALLCAGRAGACMGTMTFAGALPVLRDTWHMSASTAGTIQTAFNLSNALALLVAAWLSDSYGAKRVYLACTWAGAAALAGFAWLARSPESALIGIVFVGLTQGGAYAPALMLAADLGSPAARGRAIGQMLAAGSFGYLLSVFLALWATQTYGVAAGFSLCAAGVFAGALLSHVSLSGTSLAPARGRAMRASAARPSRPLAVWSPVAVCLLVGYVAHCWELLGNYAWTPSLLAVAVAPLHLDTLSQALLIGAVVHSSGMLSTVAFGVLSDRWDRAQVLVVVAGAGAACSILMGFSMQWGPVWTVLIAAIGSFFILGDSGVLSAAITDAVPPDRLGRVMGVRSVIGFGAGALAPTTFGATFDATHQWSWAYGTLALGGGAACCAALCLRWLVTAGHRHCSS
ncbi:MFS transporter [Paraburkholderia tagetis]|uniref:MFS transporter n=1 Tax=Paraburkholderia tagetis TaxID=2913261 RepID=UPI003084016F